MSKSMKNFITIKALLKTYNARQLRLLFLLQNYEKLMNYSSSNLILNYIALNISIRFDD